MLGDLFSGWHIFIVLAIVLLLFGATRLPALARALGQSRNAFKSEMKKGEESDASAKSDAAAKADSAAAPEETSNTTPKS